MSVKVLSHNDRTSIVNPVNGQVSNMVNVTFIEEGRKGAIDSLASSSDALSDVLGVQMGLTTLRVHTQAIPESELGRVQIGAVIDGLHINRKMFSTPQLPQQVGRAPRMVEGRPTFFTTSLDKTVKDDDDLRISNEALAKIAPWLFTDANVGATKVIVRESAPGANGQRFGTDGGQRVRANADGSETTIQSGSQAGTAKVGSNYNQYQTGQQAPVYADPAGANAPAAAGQQAAAHQNVPAV
jgi:hypothetical protein